MVALGLWFDILIWRWVSLVLMTNKEKNTQEDLQVKQIAYPRVQLAGPQQLFGAMIK